MAGPPRFDYRQVPDGFDAARARSGLGLYVVMALFFLTTVWLGQYMGGVWPVAFPVLALALIGYSAFQDLSPFGPQRIEIRGREIRVTRWAGVLAAPLASIEPTWVHVHDDGLEALRLRSADTRVDVLLPGLTDEQATVILDALARSAPE